MKPIELVALINKANPEVLGNKITEATAAGIIRAALIQLAAHIDAVDEGVVNVAGLGNFRVKQVAHEKDGEKKTVKKTLFVVAKPKA